MSDASTEPLYVAQTGDCRHPGQLRAWSDAQMAKARAAGASFFRFSFESDGGIHLIEGWAEQPADPGKPRFSTTAPSRA